MTSRRTGRYKALFRPWSGFVGGGLGWALAHQLGSDGSFDHCAAAGWEMQLLVGILGLAMAFAGAAFAWPLWKGRAPEDGEARPFLALVGSLSAAVFALAILLQTLAGIIIPRCHG